MRASPIMPAEGSRGDRFKPANPDCIDSQTKMQWKSDPVIEPIDADSSFKNNLEQSTSKWLIFEKQNRMSERGWFHSRASLRTACARIHSKDLTLAKALIQNTEALGLGFRVNCLGMATHRQG